MKIEPKKAVLTWSLWLFYVALVSFVGAAVIYGYRKVEKAKAQDEAWRLEQNALNEKKARRGKAEALAREGFEVLAQQRRNNRYAVCRAQGNVPMLFLDKIICVKQEAIAWEKRDELPEQDTSGDEPLP